MQPTAKKPGLDVKFYYCVRPQSPPPYPSIKFCPWLSSLLTFPSPEPLSGLNSFADTRCTLFYCFLEVPATSANYDNTSYLPSSHSLHCLQASSFLILFGVYTARRAQGRWAQLQRVNPAMGLIHIPWPVTGLEEAVSSTTGQAEVRRVSGKDCPA